MLSLLTKGNLIRYQIVLVSGDVFIALGLFLFVHNSLPLPFNGLEWGGIIITPTLLMISYLCGRYQASTPSRLKVLYFSIIVGLIGIFFFLTGSVVIVGSLSAFLVIQNEWHKIVHKVYDAMLLKQKFLILGTGPLAEKAERLINDESDQYSLLGFIGTPKDHVTVPQGKILGTIEDVVEIAKTFEAQSIIIALTEKRGNPFMDQLVTCKLNGVRIIDYPVFSEMMTGKIPIEDINPSWLVQSNG
ncbi:MAG: glycosyltransferase, partial [Candidatus Electrothrix sp. ATG2]|nr:glycosyltransferase [Candidatus Electrothrix sp. ATG2]